MNKMVMKSFNREKDVYHKSDKAYQIATCYRQQNDTSANVWYMKVIQNYKDNLKRNCSPYTEVKSIVYFHIGMSYTNSVFNCRKK